MEGSGSVQIITDPDLRGPKTYGSGTLLQGQDETLAVQGWGQIPSPWLDKVDSGIGCQLYTVQVFQSTLESTSGEVIVKSARGPVHHAFLWIRQGKAHQHAAYIDILSMWFWLEAPALQEEAQSPGSIDML